jgi:hypothetical protein
MPEMISEAYEPPHIFGHHLHHITNSDTHLEAWNLKISHSEYYEKDVGEGGQKMGRNVGEEAKRVSC